LNKNKKATSFTLACMLSIENQEAINSFALFSALKSYFSQETYLPVPVVKSKSFQIFLKSYILKAKYNGMLIAS